MNFVVPVYMGKLSCHSYYKFEAHLLWIASFSTLSDTSHICTVRSIAFYLGKVFEDRWFRLWFGYCSLHIALNS